MIERSLVLVLGLAVGMTGCEEPVSPQQEPEAAAGKAAREGSDAQASELALPDLQGVERRISDWRGEIVLVNFWATWCTPCLREIPALREVRREYADRGFEVLGIAIDQKDSVVRFVAEQQIEYPILNGEDAGLAMLAALGNKQGGLPFSVVFDRSGGVALRHLGELTPAQMRAEIEKLL